MIPRILSVIIRNDTEFTSREFRGSRTPRVALEEFGRFCDVCFIRQDHFFSPKASSFMFIFALRPRGLISTQQSRRSLIAPCALFSRSFKPPDKVQTQVMLGNQSAKSFESSVSRVATSNTLSTSKSPLTTGVKRKREMANIGQSALGSLHSAVYFDENDFDDDFDIDDELDFVPLPQHKKVMPDKQSPTEIFKRPDTTGARPTSFTPNTDIKYPELPPFIENEGPAQTAPSSSGQFTWPSSPPSHLLPPPKRRTLPWNEVEPSNAPRTPRENKPSYPWNKTASAVKDEQKELRRQNKQRQQVVKPNVPHPPRKRVASLFLSDEQRTVLDAVVDRNKSIFFTGSAGTGKSVLMREIIKKLREKHRKEIDRVAVTASTGLAACNIGGVTLHSFAGIGLGKEEASELVKKVVPQWNQDGATILIYLRFGRIRKPEIVGYVQRFSSLMRYLWWMAIFLTSLKKSHGP